MAVTGEHIHLYLLILSDKESCTLLSSFAFIWHIKTITKVPFPTLHAKSIIKIKNK